MCKLCGSYAPIRKSHIIPRFIGKWMKDTSATPYLRYGGDMDKRRQDVFTMDLLCDDCETLFSSWETKFARQIFYPITNGQAIIRYRQWLLKFAASLTWRALHFYRFRMPDDYRHATQVLDKMEDRLSGFLIGRENDLGAYTHHIYPVDIIDAPVVPGSPSLNRYLARTVDINVLKVEDLSEVFVYVKLPRFIFLAVAEASDRKWLESSRIKKSSTIQPRDLIIEESVWLYIIGQADLSAELIVSMSPKSKKATNRAFLKAMEDEPEKVMSSDLFRAVQRDYEFYGEEAFDRWNKTRHP